MHELSIALSLIDIAGEELERHGGDSIIAIHLKLGALAGVVKSALTSAFELAREGSAVAKSSLIVEDVPITVFCPSCQGPQPVAALDDLCCARCGTYTSDIVSGRELEIFAMEIES